MQGQWRIAFLGSAAQVERYPEMAENGQFACRWGDLGQLAEENGYESSSMEGKSALILRSSNDGNISGFLDMLEMVHAKLPEMEIILATLATDFPEDGWDVTHWRAGESTYRTGTLAWSGMEDAWDEEADGGWDEEEDEALDLDFDALDELFGDLDCF